ncbi:MAG: S8 family serine peptidase [Anaerolineales bacterium]
MLPNPDYVSTIVRAPIAWLVSRGTGVKVGVIQNHNEDLAVLGLIAPDAKVIALQVNAQFRVGGKTLKETLAEDGIRVLVVPQPKDFNREQALQVWKEVIAAGVSVFSGIEQTDSTQAEIAAAYTQADVLVVGCQDGNGLLLGDGSTLKAIPLFAPDRQGNRLNAPLVAAGVGALVLNAEPSLTPAQLTQRLLSTADEMYQASDFEGNWSPMNIIVDEKTGDYSPGEYAFRFKRVNAANAVGAKLDTIWPVNALNAPAAWKTATGRGVTVAVLDQGFHYQNPLFEGHLVDKVAFVQGKTFESEQNFHGTAMAKIVLNVAPDASLEFLLTDERADAVVQEAYVKAIDYAVAHGAKVITNSAGPWANTPEIHAAIDRAIKAGVVYVWFHYDGTNPAVIRPGHFYFSQWEVGAFDRFFDSDKPSDLEGGLSETAPQIAGIAALILQNEPQLTPMQVKQRILETATILPGGFSLADAAAAVENRPSGRSVPILNTESLNGRMRVVYQKSGSDEKLTLTVTDQRRNWPIPIFPPADVLMFKYQYGAQEATYMVLAYPENQGAISLRLITEQTKILSTGDITLSDLVWNMSAQEMDTENYYRAGLSKNNVKMQVTVDGGHIHLHWEGSEAIPLYRMVSLQEQTLEAESSYLIYEIDVEGDFLPLQVITASIY